MLLNQDELREIVQKYFLKKPLLLKWNSEPISQFPQILDHRRK
jgi:hypothetical protein